MTGTPCAREKSVDRSSDDRKRKRSGDTMAAPKKGKIGKLKCGARLRVVPLLGKMGTIFQQVYVFWRAAVASKETLFRCNEQERLRNQI